VVDVLALRHDACLLVQCKRGERERLSPGDWNALWDLAQETYAVPILAHRPPGKSIRYWRLTGPKIVGVRNSKPPKVPYHLAG
jgi:Holliday junction resolvase